MGLFDKRSTQSELTRPQALACVPVVNRQVGQETTAAGRLRLEYPLALKPFFLSLARRFGIQQGPLTKKLELDDYGRQVWELVDGRRQVSEIIRLFAKSSGLSLEEAEAGVVAFLRQLGRRGLIEIRLPLSSPE